MFFEVLTLIVLIVIFLCILYIVICLLNGSVHVPNERGDLDDGRGGICSDNLIKGGSK